MNLNPMAIIVEGYRDALLRGEIPSWEKLLGVMIFGLILAFLGYTWFMKTKKVFADII
jgi:lipopolysaccharide transport system permease protein